MVTTVSGNSIAQVARLIGDPARANILSALMGGQALTAGELTCHAGVTAQTTSGHLSKLVDSNILFLEKQGRHRYYRLASVEIAEAIRAIGVVAGTGPKRHHPPGPREEAMRLARICYDHMAGRLALAITKCLLDQGYVEFSDGAGLITQSGRDFFQNLGIDLERDRKSRRPLCRTCLDWSERRHHIAGRLGADLLLRLLELKWVARVPNSRALRISHAGELELRKTFNLPADWQDTGIAAWPDWRQR